MRIAQTSYNFYFSDYFWLFSEILRHDLAEIARKVWVLMDDVAIPLLAKYGLFYFYSRGDRTFTISGHLFYETE